MVALQRGLGATEQPEKGTSPFARLQKKEGSEEEEQCKRERDVGLPRTRLTRRGSGTALHLGSLEAQAGEL